MTWKCTNTPKGENKLYSDAKGVVPSLDLRFAEGKNLNDYMTGTPLVDHQRSMSGSNLSAGTFVNSNGLIETAKVNALTANSEVFSGWPIPSTSTQTTTSPFNTTAASIDSATALSISVNDSSAVTFSGYFKQGSSRYVYLRPVVWADNPRVWFDLQTGNFVNVSPAAAPISNAFATSVGNGWYRCGFTLDSTGDSVGNLQITATDSSTNINSVGYVFAFGIQVEEGPVSTYIPTTTSASAAPRFDHDPTTGESLGLLIEESRTNILLNSATLSTQSVTTSATAYTLSFYGTGTVTLSGTSTAGPLVGTGANDRVTLTFTPTAGTLTLTVTGTVSNAQLEQGSFPTSYIPTTGTALTRSADVASITGSNFSSWYNQSEGSIYAAYDSTGGSPTRAAYGLGNTTSSQGTNNESNPSKFTWFDGITALSTVNTFDFSTGVGKTAAGFTDTAVSICLEGGTVATGTQAAYTDTQIVLGARGAGTTKFLNGHLVRLTYFPERLPDSSLQTITTP